ncbi:hypothetical protein [Mangrovimonas xylaniphaga]|uniref:hypothetical protein n=1 Tax=Mangrovimonas xylaniphaga TaxID=1645915 RepID=UPI0006B629B7|nr:hypothetical protein [Mangrovimonas xylaniphaga]
MVQDLDTKELLTSFLYELDDYSSLDSLKFLVEDSSKHYHSYQITYWTANKELKTLLVEIDLLKGKMSFGPWGACAMETVKF